MRKRFVCMSIAIASVLALVLSAVPAKASYATDDYVYLTDTSSLWNVTVQKRGFVALDDRDGYWNWTLFVELDQYAGDPVGAEERLNVTMYINDGATNLSVGSGSITPSLTARVYANLSIAEASYSAMVANSTCEIYILLENTTDDSDLDAWTGVIRIDTLEVIGMMWIMIPTIVGFIVVIAIMGCFMDVMDNMTKPMKGPAKGKRGGKSGGKSSKGKGR